MVLLIQIPLKQKQPTRGWGGVLSEFDTAVCYSMASGVEHAVIGHGKVEGPVGRPTEYDGSHLEPPDWWDIFWQRHFANTGQSRNEVIAMLRKLLGANWQTASLEEAERATMSPEHSAGNTENQ